MDDDDRAPADVAYHDQLEALITAALTRLAEQDLADRETAKGPVGDRKAWLRAATARRRLRHADQLEVFRTTGDVPDLEHFDSPPAKLSPIEMSALAAAKIRDEAERARPPFLAPPDAAAKQRGLAWIAHIRDRNTPPPREEPRAGDDPRSQNPS